MVMVSHLLDFRLNISHHCEMFVFSQAFCCFFTQIYKKKTVSKLKQVNVLIELSPISRILKDNVD